MPAHRPVLIADPDERTRDALGQLFADAGHDVHVTASGKDALDVILEIHPLAVILEVALPGISGYEICRAVRARFGESVPIVFVSGSRTESFDRVAGLLVGADDYVVKPYAADELLVRVRRLLREPTELTTTSAAKLTRRESEVLSLLAQGLEQEDIASRRFIAPKTVGTHIEHILAKLGVRSRAQAVALAYRNDLVRPDARPATVS